MRRNVAWLYFTNEGHFVQVRFVTERYVFASFVRGHVFTFGPQRDVQERELSLIREYETKLLSREEENATEELMTNTTISASLARLSHVLRRLLRAECGEDDEEPPETRTEEEEEEEPWNARLAAEHSMEREIELARLQAENEQLKQMLGLLPRQMPESRLEGDYRPTLNLTRDGKYVPYGRGPPKGPSGREDE